MSDKEWSTLENAPVAATPDGADGGEKAAAADGEEKEKDDESGVEKGEIALQVTPDRLDGNGMHVEPQQPQEPQETEEQRVRRLYEEKLRRYNEVTNELKNSKAKVLVLCTVVLLVRVVNVWFPEIDKCLSCT